jgi:hypothetical protein
LGVEPSWPLKERLAPLVGAPLPGAIDVQLESVAVRVVQEHRHARTVVLGVAQHVPMIQHALNGLGQREPSGVEAGVPRWRERAPFALPRVQGDVIVVAARRQPGRLYTDLVWTVGDDVESQNVAVDVGGPLEVGDLKMYVADTDLRMDGARSWRPAFSGSGRTVTACTVRYSPNLVEGVWERFGKALHIFDAEEVSGSNPLSPTLRRPANQNRTKAPGLSVTMPRGGTRPASQAEALRGSGISGSVRD